MSSAPPNLNLKKVPDIRLEKIDVAVAAEEQTVAPLSRSKKLKPVIQATLPSGRYHNVHDHLRIVVACTLSDVERMIVLTNADPTCPLLTVCRTPEVTDSPNRER